MIGARSIRWLVPLALVAIAGVARAQSGSCCLPNGGCIQADLYACAAQGGQLLVAGSCGDCVESTGACCLDGGGCTLLAASDSASCATVGGDWQGLGSTCIACLDVPGSCGVDAAGGCFDAGVFPGCDEEACCALVCANDAFCCAIVWDDGCAALAGAICGPPADSVPATLTGLAVARGTLLSGSTTSLVASDNDRVRIRAEVRPNPPVRHVVDVRIVAATPGPDVDRLDVVLELGANQMAVDTRVLLRDFDAGTWRRLDRFELGASGDVVRRVMDVAHPRRYVDTDGRLIVRVLMRTSGTYVARLDRLTVHVLPADPS